jgi:erythromycin esterase-like protein
MALQFGVPTFGDYLWDKYGEKIYSLGFTVYQGKYRLVDWEDKVWDTPRAPEGSFDWICHEAGVDNVYVNFRTIPDNHWLREKFIMRLLENSNLELLWPDHFDGVLFIHTEEPVSPL